MQTLDRSQLIKTTPSERPEKNRKQTYDKTIQNQTKKTSDATQVIIRPLIQKSTDNKQTKRKKR